MGRTRARQLGLTLGDWRSRRRGKAKGGRPPKGAKAGQPHATRPRLTGEQPVHVTWRVRPEVWNMQGKRIFRRLLDAFARANAQPWIRLTHFSVQANHLHLVIEPIGTAALSRGMQALGVRLAKMINKQMGRRGSVFDDRFFSRPLRSRAEVKNAILYVFNNSAKHARRNGGNVSDGTFDFFMGGPGNWLQGWRVLMDGGPPPIEPPRTRLLKSWLALTPAG